MINNIDKINIIDKKISNLNIIYQANLINIDKINDMGPEPDYGLDVCVNLKNDLELKIRALNILKDSLINNE